MNVVNDRTRIQALAEINRTYNRAGQLFGASGCTQDRQQSEAHYQEAMALSTQADAMAEQYYQQYPNCMSRNVSPWVK